VSGHEITPMSFEVLWRCDACGFEQLCPRDDPPANCSRCRHPSVFWVREGVEPDAKLEDL
jgi:rubrerythrin